MKKILPFCLVAALALQASPSLARPHDGPDRPFENPHFSEPHHHRWHGDIHFFHDYDLAIWTAGAWFHMLHDGRMGWWWVVNGTWYFYPSPVYPYPDPYTPPMVVLEPSIPAGAKVYWRCTNPDGYYPYVSACFGPWEKQIVTAAPVVVAPPTTIVTPPVVEPAAPTILQPAQGTRTADDRKLNALGAEFADIDLHDKKARTKLELLEVRIDDFKQSLFERRYNAMDILKDTEKLAKQVKEAIRKTSKHKKVKAETEDEEDE